MGKGVTPRNWPPNIAYLSQPSISQQITQIQRESLRSRPSDPFLSTLYSEKITPIHETSHPAHGQAGLFAARHLESGTLIIPYYGIVHASSAPHCSAHESSDYDLWLDREAGIAVDAAQAGNEARFVNDYRGVDSRPNAEFKECYDARNGQKCMAVFVLPAGKNSTGGIAKGHEILVSYGKGFWSKRRDESEAESGQEAALKTR
ncbi:hypothetical protein F5Y18DRAFT_136478 [Xylariaceae sp. FL1019]|nr:hypothetical protein F5Y18DRAFT_136478 [Xylariaceae sp. FL1019]